MAFNLIGKSALAAAVALTALAVPALAAGEGEDDKPSLFVELNSVTALEGSCRVTLLATNALSADIGKLVFETVLLDTNGVVERLTLFDLQDLPRGRPRVRQFDVPGLACDNLGKVLINGVSTCDGDGLDPSACSKSLELDSRTDIEVLG